MSKPWLPNREPSEAAKPAPLGPLLAGARARGVADGLSWLGLAAILIDDRGEALHVNPSALELMGESLRLEKGRLRARQPADDLKLTDAVRDALTLGETRSFAISSARGDIWVHIAPMPADPDDPYQLLRAVALLRPAPQTARN